MNEHFFLIFLEEPDPNAWDTAKNKWGDNIYVAENSQIAFLFPPPSETITTRAIQDEIKISNDRIGFVIQVERPFRMSGFYYSDIWELLRNYGKSK